MSGPDGSTGSADGGSPPAGATTMAPRRRDTPPRRLRRGASHRTRTRPARPPIGSGVRRELVRNALIESRLTPNAISLTGFALNLVAAALVWERLFFLGGVAFVVGSIMDTLDGRYSRMSGKGTPFGAFLDSTLDRIEEGIVLTAVAGYFALRGDRVAAAAVVVAVLASLMVSYTRARAEALGVECKVGIATRPVRVVILAIGLLFARGASLGNFELLAPAVYVLAVLSLVTVAQRIAHVRRELSEPASSV
jgi:CDP-diacylglycerol--glycerol-3-phosphate 3-phosphatidyltransferase